MSKDTPLSTALAGLHTMRRDAGVAGPLRPQDLSGSRPQRLGVTGSHGPKLTKRDHPDFESLKVYVRRSTKLGAWHKYQVDGGTELSDLVEMLLKKYLEGKRA